MSGTFLDWMLADLPQTEREQLLADAESNLAAACDCGLCCEDPACGGHDPDCNSRQHSTAPAPHA